MAPGQVVRLLRIALPIAAAALLAALPATALAKNRVKHHSHHKTIHNGFDGDHHGGFVYTTTNDPSGNAVLVFRRNHDGTLTQGPTVSTGGTGIAAQPPFGFPIVDSSGSMALADDGQLLFVVNDGDNTISALRATGNGLRLADRASSGGVLPVSLTVHGHLLYVVNEQSSTIAGYYFSDSGRLWPIPGS